MKVLVTGSSGFLGNWVCEALKLMGHTPVGLDYKDKLADQSWLEFYECDILKKLHLVKIFKKICPQRVIHLAARVDLNEEENLFGYDANISGVKNIIDCASETTSVDRIIITSSQLVCKIGYLPKSDSDYCPTTLYGESKVWTEKITRELDGGGKEWCVVRPTTVWGPKMSPHYQTMLDLIWRGLYFHCGSGKLYKSYAYAGNIAYQYLQLLQAPPEQIQGETFYLADYEPISLREYADSLAKAMKSPSIPTLPLPIVKSIAFLGDCLNRVGFKGFPFNSFRVNNILTEYNYNLEKTRNICGDLPYTFQDGIDATVRWFLNKVEDR